MKILKYLLSIIKTIYFNIIVFDLKTAIKLPVFISYDMKLENYYKGCIEINSDLHRFMIKFNVNKGSNGVNIGLRDCGFLSVLTNGKIIFNGSAEFCKGISIRVDSGKIVFGDKFYCNKNCFFTCNRYIEFRENVLIGWNVKIRDSDGHKISSIKSNKIYDNIKPVRIGRNVWIASEVDILKGVIIPDNSVIGYRSLVNKEFEEENCIIAGDPAVIVKKDIEWEH